MADEAIFTPSDAYEIPGARPPTELESRSSGWEVFRTRQVLGAVALASVFCVVGHGYGLVPATSAELALAAAYTNVFEYLEGVGQLKMVDEPVLHLRGESGVATVSTGPGLGTDLHEADPPEFAVQSRTLESES